MVPGSRFVLIAAIVSTTPAIFAAVYICFICVFIKPCSSNMYLKDCIKGFVFIIQMFAALIAIVGAVVTGGRRGPPGEETCSLHMSHRPHVPRRDAERVCEVHVGREGGKDGEQRKY